MNEVNNITFLTDLIENPIKSVLQLYIEYLKDGIISKEKAKEGIEIYGAISCLGEVKLDKDCAEFIGTYRRKVVDWAKSVIDALEIKKGGKK
jgi:hypothetical protein